MPDTQNLILTSPVHILASAETAGTPALPRFQMLAYTGGPMKVASWRYPVVVDLTGMAIPSQSRPVRFGHDAGSGIGHTDSIRVEAGQLTACGLVSRDTSAAKEIVASGRNGFPWQASIGASVEQVEFLAEGKTAQVNGREVVGPVNIARKSTLGEISFVDLGADGNTSARIAASSKGETMPDSATTSGTAETNATETPVVQATTPANPPVNGATETAQQVRAAAVAESTRIAEIRKHCAGRFHDIEAKAISEGWDAQKTQLEVLRAGRPTAPAIHVHVEAASQNVLEAACLLTAKHEEVEKLYDDKTLEAAQRRFRGGLGLQELLLEAAWANGYTGRNFRDTRSVLRFAFHPELEAGFSTIDISGILSNVTNKFLLEGFYSVERTWRNICAVRSVNDFKTVTSYRLIGNDQYEQVAPGGELKHGSLGNETYSNKADTYGIMLSVDRRDIINDDLGAITTVPRKHGRGSGLKINDVFWTIFMNNSAFFTAGNKNYLTGATSALAIDGMSAAEQAFMDQVDSDGKPIGVMPAILLVPTGLAVAGTQLHKSLEMRDTTANTKTLIANPHAGKYRPEVSRYLGNAKYAGNSQKAWYLLADPNDLPVIEVAFLNGNESPTIETADANFNMLGIQMRGYHDFGVALQDNRGGVKSKGEA